MKFEYEQKGIYFECRVCPDCVRTTYQEGGHKCGKNGKKIDVNPFEEIPDWCPRFPL